MTVVEADQTIVETDRPGEPARKRRGRRRRDLGEHVARTVAVLQARVLRTVPQPEAVSALARLRRGIGRTPGFDYTLERYVQVPEHLPRRWASGGGAEVTDAEATDAEHAVHDAVTLYALHQQSQRERMHVDGHGLGQAMATLVRRAPGPEGVRRRFAALGTASSYEESIYHLRSLVTMLRQQQIPLDYGLLADDLQTLRGPDGRPRVQAIWGREFFRSGTGTDVDTSATPTDLPEENPS
ncbi:type I-E CRISPR-associated protein Cse2/CasB [Plantactinospora sp. WMMB334]|uniref:type I-E CRISPR-associated protein Cse2/CasB n=1 Tax=Plantactinospora sp. WMMB334 TaxID=3404119 RepID=UPI003B95A7C4